MEGIEWALATIVGILVLLVLMLALLALGVWLLRQICRVWNAKPSATGDQEDVPS